MAQNTPDEKIKECGDRSWNELQLLEALVANATAKPSRSKVAGVSAAKVIQ